MIISHKTFKVFPVYTQAFRRVCIPGKYKCLVRYFVVYHSKATDSARLACASHSIDGIGRKTLVKATEDVSFSEACRKSRISLVVRTRFFQIIRIFAKAIEGYRRIFMDRINRISKYWLLNSTIFDLPAKSDFRKHSAHALTVMDLPNKSDEFSSPVLLVWKCRRRPTTWRKGTVTLGMTMVRWPKTFHNVPLFSKVTKICPKFSEAHNRSDD